MSTPSPLKVSVVGASGAVGKEILSILELRAFPCSELIPFASPRSEGQMLVFNKNAIACQTLKPGCFEGVQIVFFDASDEVSRKWVPEAAAAGAWVVDNSGAFRLDNDVPLIIPEVNGEELEARMKLNPPPGMGRVIAGPNCTTVQLAMALKPISDLWGLKRVVVSTYQSTSGAGKLAMDELSMQTAALMNQENIPPQIFPHQIAFNCIPQIGSFGTDGVTTEETKLVNESRKILGLPMLKMSATSVRVPTFSCHAESVNIECEKPFEIKEIRAAVSAQPGVTVIDQPERTEYPIGVSGPGGRVRGAAGQDAVYVGRIRKDTSVENGLNLWVVSDNLRKGAALNAVQIGEILLGSFL